MIIHLTILHYIMSLGLILEWFASSDFKKSEDVPIRSLFGALTKYNTHKALHNCFKLYLYPRINYCR